MESYRQCFFVSFQGAGPWSALITQVATDSIFSTLNFNVFPPFIARLSKHSLGERTYKHGFFHSLVQPAFLPAAFRRWMYLFKEHGLAERAYISKKVQQYNQLTP